MMTRHSKTEDNTTECSCREAQTTTPASCLSNEYCHTTIVTYGSELALHDIFRFWLYIPPKLPTLMCVPSQLSLGGVSANLSYALLQLLHTARCIPWCLCQALEYGGMRGTLDWNACSHAIALFLFATRHAPRFTRTCTQVLRTQKAAASAVTALPPNHLRVRMS
jgi:hypothetical protein